MNRPFTHHAAVTALLALLAAPTSARADIMPSGGKGVKYSFEIEGLAAHPDVVFVLWPRMCGTAGEPLGEVNYTDASLKERHEVDYEVLSEGAHELLRYCAATARVYALSAAKFPTESHVGAEDDWRLGRKVGERYLVVPAIDALTLKARVPFFANARHAAYPFEFLSVLRRDSPIRSVHDVLTVRALDDTRLELGPRAVTYGYADGGAGTLPWTSGKHPRPPGQPDALKAPRFGFGDTDGAADLDYGADLVLAPADAANLPDAAPSLAPPPPADGPWPPRLGVAAIVVALGAALALASRLNGRRPPRRPRS